MMSIGITARIPHAKTRFEGRRHNKAMDATDPSGNLLCNPNLPLSDLSIHHQSRVNVGFSHFTLSCLKSIYLKRYVALQEEVKEKA